jgi:hypothetical protein
LVRSLIRETTFLCDTIFVALTESLIRFFHGFGCRQNGGGLVALAAISGCQWSYSTSVLECGRPVMAWRGVVVNLRAKASEDQPLATGSGKAKDTGRVRPVAPRYGDQCYPPIGKILKQGLFFLDTIEVR